MTRAQRRALALDELNREMEADLGPNHDASMRDDCGPPQPAPPPVCFGGIGNTFGGSAHFMWCTCGDYPRGRSFDTAEEAQRALDEHLAAKAAS